MAVTTDPPTAADQANHLFHHLAASRVPHLSRFGVQAPPWLLRVMSAHQREVDAMTAHRCDHVTPGRPMVVHIAACRPGMAVCSTCAKTGMLEETGDPRRCDPCGQTFPDPLAGGIIQWAATMIWFRVCSACEEDVRMAPSVS